MKLIFKVFPTALFLLISSNLFSQDTPNTSISSQEIFKELIDSSSIYYSLGDYKKSMDVNMKILKEGQKRKIQKYILMGYRYLGYDYMALKDSLMAQESFSKSEKYAQKSNNDTVIALTYMDLANFYSSFKGKDFQKKSIKYHTRSIALMEKMNDTLNLSAAYTNAADTYLDADKLEEAYGYLIKAKKYGYFLAPNAKESLSAGLELLFGEYYYKSGDYLLADEHLKNCLRIALDNNFESELKDGYEYLSKSLSAQGRYEEAYKSRTLFEKYKEITDRTKAKVDTDGAIAQFQIGEYRKDVKAAELQTQLQKEITINKSRQNDILTIITISALIIIIIFFFTFYRRKQLVKELKIKNKEYLEAKEESERLARSKTKFFSTVSHELRTPLYGVIGLSSLLLEDESLKKHREDLKSLKFSANYLMALINDVLQINKIDSKSLETEEIQFNVGELIKTITTSFEYMRLQNKNAIEVVLGPDLPAVVKGNATRLSQILMNLIGNACKFTENGTIWVMVDCVKSVENRSTISFEIKDTGIGIAKEMQEIIFEEFSQGESANYTYQGTGLGLPIVKKLLVLEVSEILLKSEIGTGSSFSFQLIYENACKSETISEITPTQAVEIKGKRILIVEDNRINQIVTRKILEKNGIICTIAENGEEAVKIIKKQKFDLVLMDINMPLKNGLEATREVRLFNNSLPIIALTAVEVAEMRCEIFNSGMNDIIVKPYDVTKFMGTISKNIKESALIRKRPNNSLKTG